MNYAQLRKSAYRIGKRLVVQATQNSIVNSNGQKVKLQPKMMSVLTLLSANSKKVVSREEIINRIWSDSFSGELALNQCISRLRKVFIDLGENNSVIKTIPKEGYVLTLDVKNIRNSTTNPAQNWPISRLKLTVGFVLALLFITYLISSNHRKTQQVIEVQGSDSQMVMDISKKVNQLKLEGKSTDQIFEALSKVLPDTLAQKVVVSGDSILLLRQ